VDITPRIPAGRQIINAYGGGGFRVAGIAYRGSILVFPDRTLAWPISQMDELQPESFAAVRGAEPAVGILLLGCGASIRFLPRTLREGLRAHGIVVDCMDSGAACRTFNVLLAEERRVAAALIAID